MNDTFIGQNDTEFIEQDIQRPHYAKIFDNRTELYRNLAPDADGKQKKTVCVQFCWIFWGLLGLAIVALGVLFGLGLLTGFNIWGEMHLSKGPDFPLINPPIVPIIPIIVPGKPEAGITGAQITGGNISGG